MKSPKRISDEHFDRALGLFREPSSAQVESSQDKVWKMIDSASDAGVDGGSPELSQSQRFRISWKFVLKPLIVVIVLAGIISIVKLRNSDWISGSRQVQSAQNLLAQSNHDQSITERMTVPTPQLDGGSPRARGNPFVVLQPETFVVGAWWTNSALAAQMGLTNEQKMTLEAAFENRRDQLTDLTSRLDQEEEHLFQLLEKDNVDANAVLGQIDRAIQVRDDLERQTAAMTLEMRRVVSGSQWSQVPRRSLVTRYRLFPRSGQRASGSGKR